MDKQRELDNRRRYVRWIEEDHPDSGKSLREAFLKEMADKEYGREEMGDAFGWFWRGWCARVEKEFLDGRT